MNLFITILLIGLAYFSMVGASLAYCKKYNIGYDIIARKYNRGGDFEQWPGAYLIAIFWPLTILALWAHFVYTLVLDQKKK